MIQVTVWFEDGDGLEIKRTFVPRDREHLIAEVTRLYRLATS